MGTFGRAADRRQPQLDKLHRLLGIGMIIGLAVRVVEGRGQSIKAGAGDRPIGERNCQLVGLAAIAQVSGAQQCAALGWDRDCGQPFGCHSFHLRRRPGGSRWIERTQICV